MLPNLLFDSVSSLAYASYPSHKADFDDQQDGNSYFSYDLDLEEEEQISIVEQRKFSVSSIALSLTGSQHSKNNVKLGRKWSLWSISSSKKED
jgi:hypothetical protein